MRKEPGGGGGGGSGGRFSTTASYLSIHRGPPASHDSKQYRGPLLCCSLITAGTCHLIVVQLALRLIEGMHADKLEDSLTASLDL